jgi:hypothetical protein
MFRPLSSALMWLDLAAFGDNAFAYHLHSAVWWASMAAMLALLLRRVLPGWAALLALLLFCADEAHGMLLGWIANRNAIVASALCLFGLWAQLRKREDGVGAGGWLALASFALALCASECAVGFLGYAALYELFGQAGQAKRLHRLLPLVALLGIYLLARAAFGFGSHGSGMYLDPFGELGPFAQAAVRRFPVLMGDLVLGVRANWWTGGFPWTPGLIERGFFPPGWLLDLRPLRMLLQGIGAVAIAAFALLCGSVLRAGGSPRDLRWLVLGVPLAILPSLSSLPESRLLVPALLGWSVVLASFVHARITAWQMQPRRASSVIGLAVAVALALYHASVPAWHSFTETTIGAQLAGAVRASILAPELDPVLVPGRRVLLVAAADPTTTIYVPLLRKLNGKPGPDACHLLTDTFVPLRLLRLSRTAFQLDRLSYAYTPGDAYAAAFNREPLHAGERFRADGLQVRVERVDEGLPTRARYELDRSLDDPDVVLLVQTVGGLRRIAFPALGQSILLAPPLPPFALVRAR